MSGGIREIIDRRNSCPAQIDQATVVEGGVLTPILDGKKCDAGKALTKAEREMANGMLYLLKMKETQKELAENCVRISRLFDSKNIAKRWECILSR